MSIVYGVFEPTSMIVLYIIASYVFIGLKKNQESYRKDPVAYLASSDDINFSKKIVKVNPVIIGGCVAFFSLAIVGYYGFIVLSCYALTVVLYSVANNKAVDKELK